MVDDSGTLPVGRLTRAPAGVRDHAAHRPRRVGSARLTTTRRSGRPPAGRRAGGRPDRHRRLLRPQCGRGAGPRGAPPLSAIRSRSPPRPGSTRPGPGQWAQCGRPEYLRQQCEGSLRRLGVDRIDLFQLHRVDPDGSRRRPVRGAQRTSATRGRWPRWGCPRWASRPIRAAWRDRAGGQRAEPVQHRPCAAPTTSSSTASRTEIGFIPWFPLASGKLSRPGGPVDRVAQGRWARPSPRCAWPGCSAARRSCSPSPAPRPSIISRRTAPPPALTLSDEQFEELSDARKPLRRWALTG